MRFYNRTEELAILTLSSSYTKFFDFVYNTLFRTILCKSSNIPLNKKNI